ncbi:MAG: hypothetical protein K2Q06_07390 [Parvularculaceae bacterium]|nr:hypothetical protein [Parvularculaceae bacterium]
MKKVLFASAALVGASFGAAAFAGSSSLSPEAAARLASFDRTGEKQQCLMLSAVSEIKPLSDEIFLVRTGVNSWYLNEVRGSCDGAANAFTRLEYTTSTSSLCSLQIVRVVDNSSGILRGTCSLGEFERLTPKPKQPPAPK